MTIIKRAQLNRPLTWDELDSNFEQVDSLVASASQAVESATNQAQTAAGFADNAAASSGSAAASEANSAASASAAQTAADNASAAAATQVNSFKADLASASSDTLGDSLVGVKAPYTATVARTQHAKNAETISVLDFGAKGDGSTNDTTAFQAAINKLPDAGGQILVPPGNYVLTPASLTVAVNKMVTWIAYEATLPDNMPGKIDRSGYQAQPYENTAGTGARPGAAYQRMIAKTHTPDPGTGSQQDSILYLEGHSPASNSQLASEFAALRFNMSSQMYDSTTNPSNLDVKGINGVSVGDAGNAKVRSIRTTSVSINQHYGLVTGIMAAAHRSGLIPTQAPFNGNGTTTWTSGVAGPYLTGDAAMIAQVGPGIQANLRLEGFAAAERPQYGLLQARGNAAINPEIAVIAVHGGGNGQIINIVRSDTDTTQIGYISRLAEVQMASFSSRTNTIAAENVISVTPPATTGFIDIFAGGTADAFVRAYFRVGTSPVMTSTGVGSNGAVTTGVLTGTTGTSGKLTISSAADGKIYIENRTGASRGVCMSFTCSPAA